MASIINPYFPKSSTLEQTLFESIKVESIQVMGREYYYLPRDLQVEDLILGEDVISKFRIAIPIEMYMEDVTGFQGDKEIFSKFGLQIQNSYRLTVSNKRWDLEVKSQFDGSGTNGEAIFVKENYRRPHEGDLIWDPLTKFLMEIKFVDQDTEFYQIGKNYLYSLSCEAYRYASEEFSTGIEEIDAINELNINELNFQIMQEDGTLLLQEDCDYSLILEDNEETPSSIKKYEYGDDFGGLINSTVSNPFGDEA